MENYVIGLVKNKINKSLENDDITATIEKWNRKVLVKLPEFVFTIISENGQVIVEIGKIGDPDIILETKLETLLDLIHDKITPLNAYSRKKVKINASLSDLRTLSRIL